MRARVGNMPQAPAVMEQKCPVAHDSNCLGTPLGEQVGKFLGHSRGPGALSGMGVILWIDGSDLPHEDHEMFLVSRITSEQTVKANLKAGDGGHAGLLGRGTQVLRLGHKTLQAVAVMPLRP